MTRLGKNQEWYEGKGKFRQKVTFRASLNPKKAQSRDEIKFLGKS